MSLKFAVEPISYVWNDMYCLTVDSWHNKDSDNLTPRYDRYVQAEKDGRLFICTARAKGEMVGFVIRGNVWNGAFLLPKYRVKYAPEMMKFAEEQREARGM